MHKNISKIIIIKTNLSMSMEVLFWVVIRAEMIEK